MSNFRCALPHRIVSDCDLIFLVSIGPLGIFLHDLERVIAPDCTVRSCDDVNGKIELADFVEFLSEDCGEA